MKSAKRKQGLPSSNRIAASLVLSSCLLFISAMAGASSGGTVGGGEDTQIVQQASKPVSLLAQFWAWLKADGQHRQK